MLPSRSAHRREPPSTLAARGQALVEFAIILPLLLVLLVMAIDFGRVFFGWVSINNAARVGAAYAAANADAWEGSGDSTRQARYEDLVENDLQAVNCTLPSIPEPTVDDADSDGVHDSGELIEVALECDFTLITPLATAILGTVDLGGAATFPVHYTITTSLPEPPPPPPPPNCTVPQMEGELRNAAQDLWTDASFQAGNLIENGTGNFLVDSQDVAAGTELPCTTGSVEISEAGGPPPPPPPTCDPPVANFTGVPTSGQTPLQVQFTDASTTQPGCPILSWSWTFGNGSSSLQNPTNIFTNTNQGNNAARYTISLTVTNEGGTDTETKDRYISVSK